MTKSSLVLRSPKWTVVVAVRFPTFPPSLLPSPLSLLLCTPSLLLPTLPLLLPKLSPLLSMPSMQLSTPPMQLSMPPVFAITVLLAALNIITCHCYHLPHPSCRSENEAVAKDNSCYWSRFNADGHCAFKIYQTVAVFSWPPFSRINFIEQFQMNQ